MGDHRQVKMVGPSSMYGRLQRPPGLARVHITFVSVSGLFVVGALFLCPCDLLHIVHFSFFVFGGVLTGLD